MGSLGTKLEIVNANAVLVRFGATPDDYILAVRKRIEYNSPQKRLATGAGAIYFTMLPDNKMRITTAYTTGEVGNAVAANFDEMIKRNATTKEVPTNTWALKFTDRQGTPASNTWTHSAKVTQLIIDGGLGEGETLVEIVLQIIDDEPTVT